MSSTAHKSAKGNSLHALIQRCTVFLLLILSSISYGHDLGISEARFYRGNTENNEQRVSMQRYYIAVETSQRSIAEYGAPTLPDHCASVSLSEEDALTHAYAALHYAFSCTQIPSTLDTLSLPWKKSGVLLHIDTTEVSTSRLFLKKNNEIRIPFSALTEVQQNLSDTATRYFELGIHHIFLGYDHLIFVLLIVIMLGFRRRLFTAITLFTLAHSLTLGFATFGVIDLPSAPVEACIALSIVVLAYELRLRQSHPHSSSLETRYPEIVIMLFGLLHGMGFAGALGELGVAAPDVPLALLSFNLGVEVGQIAFIVVCYLIVLASEKIHKWQPKIQLLTQRTMAITLNLAGGTALYWFLDRGFFSAG